MYPITRRQFVQFLLALGLWAIWQLQAIAEREIMARLAWGLTARLRNAAGTNLLVPGPVTPSASTFQACADGGWCWFADPRAVYYNGVTYFGYIDNAGNVKIRTFTHATSTVSAATTLHAALQADDHDNPTIWIRPSDARIVVFYSKHVGASIYKRVSTNPEDISAFGAETNLASQYPGSDGFTYPSPVYTSGDTKVWLFVRSHASGVAYWWYNASADGGATWTGCTHLHSQTYSKVISNGTDRIDVACSMHPDGTGGETDIYQIKHLYRQTAAWHQSDGTTITASIPYAGTDMTIVYDGGTKPVWIWDIAYDGSGNPIIVFAKFESTSDHRYWYARWTGAAWDCHEICAAGGYIASDLVFNASQVYYSGGVVLDHSDPNRAFCSRYVSGQFEIWRYVTTDGGATWTGAAITSGSTVKQIRPVVVRDHAAGLEALWLSGRYASYVDWDTATLGNVP